MENCQWVGNYTTIRSTTFKHHTGTNKTHYTSTTRKACPRCESWWLQYTAVKNNAHPSLALAVFVRYSQASLTRALVTWRNFQLVTWLNTRAKVKWLKTESEGHMTWYKGSGHMTKPEGSGHMTEPESTVTWHITLYGPSDIHSRRRWHRREMFPSLLRLVWRIGTPHLGVCNTVALYGEKVHIISNTKAIQINGNN